MIRIAIISLLIISSLSLKAQNNDVKGSKDHDLLSRMPDYNIRKYWDYEFDAHEFIVGKDQKQSIEGRKIIIRYEHQNANDASVRKPSYLQILRNYSNAIKKAGGEILYEHRNADIGYYFLKTAQGKEVWVISSLRNRSFRMLF